MQILLPEVKNQIHRIHADEDRNAATLEPAQLEPTHCNTGYRATGTLEPAHCNTGTAQLEHWNPRTATQETAQLQHWKPRSCYTGYREVGYRNAAARIP